MPTDTRLERGATSDGAGARSGDDELDHVVDGDRAEELPVGVDDHENVTRRATELAQAYYASYAEEIDEKIADNRRPLSELRELYPFAEFIQVDAHE